MKREIRVVTADDELERVERNIRRRLLGIEALTFADLRVLCDTDDRTHDRVMRGLVRAGVIRWNADYEHGPGWCLTQAGECAERARQDVRRLVSPRELS